MISPRAIPFKFPLESRLKLFQFGRYIEARKAGVTA